MFPRVRRSRVETQSTGLKRTGCKGGAGGRNGVSHLVAQLLGLLLQQHVLLLVAADVLGVTDALHVLQFLVGNLQLLLVVVMLFNFGLKVLELLLEGVNNLASSNTEAQGLLSSNGPDHCRQPPGCTHENWYMLNC